MIQLTKDETIESVEKYFDKLKHTVEFYQNFLKVGRWYSKLKKKNTLDFLAFIKLSVADYKRKIPSADQEIALEKYNDFVKSNSLARRLHTR